MGTAVMLVVASILGLWLAETAAQTASITCFYTLPTAPGQRPAVTPLVWKRRDGYEVCMRYQYKCSLNNPACLAQEAQAGTLKWHYMAASRAGCLSVAAAIRSNGVRNVLCCSTSRCNMPDRRWDPATQIVLDSWLSRSTAKPRTTVRAVAAPQPAPLVVPATPKAAATPAVAPVQVQPAAAPAALPGPRAVVIQPEAVPAPTPARTVNPLMAAVVPDSVASGDDGLHQLTSCLYGPVPGSNMVIPMVLQPGMDVCARYQFKCTAGDTSCTQQEVKSGTWKWLYMPTSSENCDYLQKLPTTRNVVCCYSNNCNKVDPKLDPKSKVQVPAAKGSGSGSSQKGTTAQFASLDATADASQRGGSSSSAGAPSSAITNKVSASSGGSSSGNSTGSGSISCYITYPWAPGQDTPQGPAVYIGKFDRDDGYETCARFSYRCNAAAATCTPAEAKSGVWKTAYSALSKATCASMRANSSMYKDVLCCDGLNCNKPESGTKVLQAPVFTVA